MTPEEVFQKLRPSLGKVFRVPKNQIRPHSSLLEDLGAESIDFAEIEAVLEQLFDVDLSEGRIEAHLVGDLTAEEFYDDEHNVTPEGLQQLGRLIPGFDPSLWAGKLSLYNLWHVLTVDSICRYVSDFLKARSITATFP